MDTKKMKEWWVFELFRDKLSEGPITDCVHRDAPDICFSLSGRKIGLEITEVFHDSFEGLSPSMQKSSFGSRFVADVIQLISGRVQFTFGIKVIFKENVTVASNRRSGLISEFVEKCLPKIVTLQNKESVELDAYFDDLPDEILHVNIVRYDNLQESFDFRSEGGVIPFLEKRHLEQVISGKESKILNWSGYDELWLLIREGNYFAGSFSLPENLNSVVSKFDRVYLIRTRGNTELIRIC